MKKLLSSLLVLWALVISAAADAAEEVHAYIPENPETALVMIHGYGQDGSRMQWMTARLQKELPNMAVYYPTAPDLAPHHGYQWFVLPGFGAEMSEQKLYNRMLTDALRNVAVINDIIDEIHTTQGIPYEDISVAGFSQGGLMALLTGMTNPNHIGKVVSFSGVPLLPAKSFSSDIVISEPEILLVEGTNDRVLPAGSLNMTEETLKALGINPETYIIKNMGHQVNSQAMQKMINFLQ